MGGGRGCVFCVGCVCVRTCVCIHLFMHIYTCVYARVYLWTCTYTISRNLFQKYNKLQKIEKEILWFIYSSTTFKYMYLTVESLTRSGGGWLGTTVRCVFILI